MVTELLRSNGVVNLLQLLCLLISLVHYLLIFKQYIQLIS